MQRTTQCVKRIMFSSLLISMCIFQTLMPIVTATDNYEPNDEILSATSVEIGSTYVVELIPDDVDFFSYTWPTKFKGKEIILYISVEVDPEYGDNWLPLRYWEQDFQGIWGSSQSSYQLFSDLNEEKALVMNSEGQPGEYCFSIAHRTSGSDSFLINNYPLATITFRIWKAPPRLSTILIFSFVGVAVIGGLFIFIRYKNKKKKKITSQND